jgi:hypothetical protein
MTRASQSTKHHFNSKPIKMPVLSDEAVIEIQDFLRFVLDVFEDHYCQQIDRFYQSIWQDLRELDSDDPPF